MSPTHCSGDGALSRLSSRQFSRAEIDSRFPFYLHTPKIINNEGSMNRLTVGAELEGSEAVRSEWWE